MNITTSKKFQERIEDFFEYCQLNYGMTITQKKRDEYNKILDRILIFPESGRVEPLLVGKKKDYRTVNFEKDFKIIYTVGKDEIRLENLWYMKRNPKSLKKDI